jgi:ubiquinone/menaquinone biosynthesis C-methylase UbiE
LWSGYYTLALAECVGPEGRVYAVDSDEKAVQALEKKAAKLGILNVEAHASSASDLGFINDESVDFVLANGLLCSMAPQQHESTVKEIVRILKPNGRRIHQCGQRLHELREQRRVGEHT